MNPSIHFKNINFTLVTKKKVPQTYESSLKSRMVTRGEGNRSPLRKPPTADGIPVLKVRGFLCVLQFPQPHVVILRLNLETHVLKLNLLRQWA